MSPRREGVRRMRVIPHIALACATAALAGVVSPHRAVAQVTGGANCTSTPANGVAPGDICQKAIDIFTFMAPQVGVALSGGNPMLGEGGTLGGPGKVSFSLHATAVDGRVPSNTVPLSVGGTAVRSDFGQQRAPVPVPAFDIAIGVIRGFPFGLTNVGGVDFLIGATYVPNVEKDRVGIRTDNGKFAGSYGVRVGILQESALVPGVSLSYRQRNLPVSSVSYTTINDTLTARGSDVTTKSYRLVAAKRFVFIGIGGGVGRDEIRSTSTFTGVINEPIVGRETIAVSLVRQTVKRSTAFANLSLGIPLAQLVFEAGWSTKGDVQHVVNAFGGHAANEGYRYGSIGFGFRL